MTVNNRYIIVESQNSATMKQYVKKCNENQLPIVYARTARKYAFVEMDLMYVLNAQAFNRDTTFMEKMIQAIERATGKDHQDFRSSGMSFRSSGIDITLGLYTTVSRVPIENAETLMLDFLAIYDEHSQSVSA